MCVAILKPKNTLPPTMQILENCFQANSDGAGMCYPITLEDGTPKLKIVKGIMSFEDFKTKFEALQATMDLTALPMLLHFRIGTHGSKASPAHTHPFPITDNYIDMCQEEIECSWAAVHNGIFHYTGGNESNYKTYGEWDNETRTYKLVPPTESPSDTMEFLKKLIHPLVAQPDFFTNEALLKLAQTLSLGNKLILMKEDGASVRFGEFIEDSGIFYSNASFRRKAMHVKVETTEKKSSKKSKKISASTASLLIASSKSQIPAGLQTCMTRFLSNEHQQLFMPYETKSSSFEAACEATGLKDIWTPATRLKYDRLYIDTLEYDPVFEPESGFSALEVLPSPKSLYYGKNLDFAYKQFGNYLLYCELWSWNSKDKLFEFYGVGHFDRFTSGFWEGLKDDAKWQTVQSKSYLDEMFPVVTSKVTSWESDSAFNNTYWHEFD